MRANELRIGNFVWLSDKNRVWEILDGYEIDQIYQNPFTEPIPLTEEWLVKFGLSKDESDEFPLYKIWVKGSFNLEYNTEKPGSFCFEVYSHYIELESVHQLQNLYFALTGEELVIKS